jgi:uncharacterized protein (DUF1800 family)
MGVRRNSGFAAVLAFILLGIPLAEVSGQATAKSSETVQVVHLLSRTTYGARAEDIVEVVAMGRDAWLERQLHPERIADQAAAERLAAFPTVSLPMGTLMRDYGRPPQAVRALRDTARAKLTPEMRRELQMKSPAALLGDLVGAKLTRAVYSERQLEEVMTDFWFNHFNVFFGKGIERYLVADYEREAIRPHVFGKFEDMVVATAQHPAMLFYLDNASSVVPDSMNPNVARGRGGRGAAPEQLVRRIQSMTEAEKERLIQNGRFTREQVRRLERGEPLVEPPLAPPPQRRMQRGINENYARELMELHTLGVDGGYTQKDVVEVARALTGWTFVRPGQGPAQVPVVARRRPGGANSQQVSFMFRPETHDVGEKVVLGTKLPAGRGIEDGLQVIRMLSRHPSTAKFIATKLVERFVTDGEAPELVDELAQVFMRTEGDLREVTRALFSSEHFYDTQYIGTKVKTPYELVASALRNTQADFGRSRRLLETLRAMGNLPYNEPAPTGFPAASEDWVNTGAMLARMNFGLALAAGFDGVAIDYAGLLGETGAGAVESARLPRLLDELLPGANTEKLEAGIRADLESRAADSERARTSRALGLIVGSPEFQKR